MINILKKYYFIYEKKNRQLYAYTDNREMFINFIALRNMNLFYIKVAEMSREDIKELFYSDRNFHILINYKFIIDQNECRMVITNAERTRIESKTSKDVLITVFVKSTIPPSIFNSKIRKNLFNIGYIQSYLYYSEGVETDIFRENLIGCFLKDFGYTMKGCE